MSSDLNRVLVMDDRLHCTSEISYGVMKGAQSITYSQFNAVSATTNQINFNVQVSSQEALVSRDIYIQAVLTFEIKVPPTADGSALASAIKMIYGKTDALAPFPLHQLIMSMNTTINNNTVTINTKDILPILLRCMSAEELAKYESTTPVLADMFMDYNDVVDFNDYLPTVNNVRNGAGDGPTPAFIPLEATGLRDGYATSATSYHANPLGSAMDAHFNGLKGRGAFKLLSVNRTGTGADANNPEVFTVKVRVTEPLLMSPWIFRGLTHHNGQAFYGIANMNFQITLDPTARRAWRYANGNKAPYITTPAGAITIPNTCFNKTIALTNVEECKLLMCVLTAPPSLLLSAKNIVPYYELPLYRTTVSQLLKKASIEKGRITYDKQVIISNSLQLSNIPDMLIIFIRKKNPENRDADYFACIDNISIQFDNVAGILVNAQQEDLWRMSVENGLHMSWEEFSGGINGVAKPFTTASQASIFKSPNADIVDAYANYTTDYAAANEDAQARKSYLAEIGVPAFSTVAGCGSVLILQMGKDIPLQEFYAPGSLGSFNLQITVKAYNQSFREDFVSGAYELCVITKNSGILVNERGATSVYLGLLTKQDVLSTSEQEPYKRSDVKG
jgi:hypothetical protein